MIRWLHSLLHYRCEREIARMDAILAAVLPRYVPVASPPGTLHERIERSLRTEATAEEDEPKESASTRWPERTIKWEDPQ